MIFVAGPLFVNLAGTNVGSDDGPSQNRNMSNL